MVFSERLNAALLDLHDAAPLAPFSTFRESCLRRLRALIPFDAAIWGSGVEEPQLIFGISAVDFPSEKLVAYGTRWQAHDALRAEVARQSGRAMRNEDFQTLESHYASEIYLEFCGPAGIEHALGVARIDPVTSVGELIFLFRGDRRAVFRDDERDALGLVMPHLVAAWRHRLLWHVARQAPRMNLTGPALSGGHAVIDPMGQVHASDEDFGLRMRALFPDWVGPMLPGPLRSLATGDGELAVAKGQPFRVHRGGDRHILSFEDPAPGLPLSPAEMRVASRFARGMTSVQVAADLRISRATVRNQLAAVYAKLGVHTKLELARRLSES